MIQGVDYAETSQTVQHILARYKMQAGTTYTKQHNQVIGIVYRNYTMEVVHGLDSSKSRWKNPSRRIVGLKSHGSSRSSCTSRDWPNNQTSW